MRKRDQPSDPQTDQKTLDFKVNTEEQNLKSSAMKNQDDINRRKIYKIKKAEEQKKHPSKQEEAPCKQKKETQSDNKKQEVKAQQEKKKQKQEQKKQSAQTIKSSQQEECQNEQANKQTNRPGNPNQSDQQPKDLQKVAVKTKGEQKSLFSAQFLSNINKLKADSADFPLNKGVGIFGGQLPKGQNLFKFSTSAPVSTPLCFTPTPLSLNENKGSEAPKLFANFSQFVSEAPIDFTKKPEIKQEKQDEDEGQNSSQFVKEQQMVVNPSKSTGNYIYKNETIIFKSKIKKLKKPNNEIIENLELLIVSQEEKKIAWVVARIETTKIPIITGFLIKNKTEMNNLNNKQENVAISLLVKKTDPKKCNQQQTNQKMQSEVQILRIQFFSAEDGRKFMEKVKEVLESL